MISLVSPSAAVVDRDTQRVQIRTSLEQWQPPREFFQIVQQWVIPANRELVRGSGGDFLEAAWVLGQFLKLTSNPIDQVRLSHPDEGWPDAFIKIESVTKSVEVTEVMEPGRRPNEEPASVRHDPVDNWLARAKAIPMALDAGIKRKVNKRYGSPSMLLVYLNISVGDLRPEEHKTEQAIAIIKARYAGSFEEIVVLWRGRLY